MNTCWSVMLIFAALTTNPARLTLDRIFQEPRTPRTILFGGFLHDENGKPFTGTLSVTFGLYGSEGSGDLLWSETQLIQVEDDGSYQVSLGSNSSNGLPADLFPEDSTRWIGIQPEGRPETRVLMMNGQPDDKTLVSQHTPPAAPRLVPFSGILPVDEGKPMMGTINVNFRLFEHAEGGTPVWLEMQPVKVGPGGSYKVLLGANSPTGLPEDLLPDGESRWLGIQPTGQAEKRVPITSALGKSQDVPPQSSRCVSFSGVIVDDTEAPIEGSLSVNFGLYDSETDGSLLWSEMQIIKLDEHGSYRVSLGAKSAGGVPEELFRPSEPRWLGIQPAGQTETRILMKSGSALSPCL